MVQVIRDIIKKVLTTDTCSCIQPHHLHSYKRTETLLVLVFEDIFVKIPDLFFLPFIH